MTFFIILVILFFIIAISKSDMLDAELMIEIEKELPENIPHIFISAVTQKGIAALKDLLWKELNKEIQK